jgi:hypothetical protein
LAGEHTDGTFKKIAVVQHSKKIPIIGNKQLVSCPIYAIDILGWDSISLGYSLRLLSSTSFIFLRFKFISHIYYHTVYLKKFVEMMA